MSRNAVREFFAFGSCRNAGAIFLTKPTHLRMSTMNLAIAGGTIVDAAQLYPSQLTRLTERLRTICRWLTDTMKQPGKP